jgi:hypothetical protein
MAERASSALSPLPLPLPLVLHVFSLLPVDARARAACVCRSWRTTLLERSLWTRLDLSPSSGVRVRITEYVLAGAAAKAGGQLAALDVRGCKQLTFDALLTAVQANGVALRELCVGALDLGDGVVTLVAELVERLLQAAPHLAACHADVYRVGSLDCARRMLRNEPHFLPLRLRTLFVKFRGGADEETVVTLAADLAAHSSLQRVVLESAPLNTPAALDAVVDAALACQMMSLSLTHCHLFPASAPALVRLLGSGTLTELSIYQDGQQLLDGPSAALLGTALRANGTLTSLSLRHLGFWRGQDAAPVLLGALTGHSSLRTLNLSLNIVEGAQNTAAGTALGALVAANAPALTELDVSSCVLDDAVLGPLFAALPANTHLRELDVAYNYMTEAFVRDVLLPAVRANASLRKLGATSYDHHSEVREAEALVAARAAAAAAAQ